MSFESIKKLLASMAALTLVNCGAGDDPSIAVQPSQDVFEQEAVERVSSMDILWVIDNSGSMKSFQDQIRANFLSFMEDFTSKNFNDFQIAVTVTDGNRDFNYNEYANWNPINGVFSESELPCRDGETQNCYNYDSDPDGRLSSTNRSELKSTNCNECDGGNGRAVNILNNTLLDELRLYCNNSSGAPNGLCRDADDNSIVNGDDKFLDLFEQIMDNTGTSGSGDERAFQSMQAALVNPLNSEFFRGNTHLAVIIVSDEDDTSRDRSGTGGCTQNDTHGVLDCPNAYSPDYFGGFLEVLANPILGATVHNMGINPVNNGFLNSYLDDLSLFGNDSERRDRYLSSSLLNNYQDNEVDQGISLRRTIGEWSDPGRKECRTIAIPGADNRFARYFARRTTELAESTGGVVASLCADFAESLENIAQTIVERTSEFFLGDRVPSQETLDQGLVFVAVRNPGESDFTPVSRDQQRQNGWDYNPDNNSIVFFGDAIPENSAEISVVFERQRFD